MLIRFVSNALINVLRVQINSINVSCVQQILLEIFTKIVDVKKGFLKISLNLKQFVKNVIKGVNLARVFSFAINVLIIQIEIYQIIVLVKKVIFFSLKMT